MAEVSAREAQEIISRAEEVSKWATESVEASRRAAKRAAEASKKTIKEAAEAWTGVFEEFVGDPKQRDKTPELTASRTAEAAGASAEAIIPKAKETSKASKESAEVPLRPLKKATGEGDEAGVKRKRKGKESQRGIETRLESLARMYAASEARQDDEKTEEKKS